VWELRPEGPAYLRSSVKLLYLTSQCVYFRQHTLPPIGSSVLGYFSRVPVDGSFLQFLNFEI